MGLQDQEDLLIEQVRVGELGGGGGGGGRGGSHELEEGLRAGSSSHLPSQSRCRPEAARTGSAAAPR